VYIATLVHQARWGAGREPVNILFNKYWSIWDFQSVNKLLKAAN
jgi:hypothetical protein